MTIEAALGELRAHLAAIDDLQSAAWLLEWDQATYMPPGGAEARARQLATLKRLAHERQIDPAVGRLLDDLEPWAESLSYDSDEAALIRLARREYQRATRLPPTFVAELADCQARSYAAWAKARPADDFAAVRPYLERTLDLSRRYSSFFPDYAHVADPLIAIDDYGLTAAMVRELFGRLREQLVPLVQAITAQPVADDACLHRTFPRKEQQVFCREVIQACGYDFERGRQDISPHPFTTDFSIHDVRFTINYNENDLGEALYGVLHEGGHAMYEQGINPAYEATPLAIGTSSSVHESQSRLWENLVGRGRSFWTFYYPRLQAIFPAQLGDVPFETFYQAINQVRRSLIRTEADEVTYNLHVMIRFDLELDLLEGRLAVRDLPEAWRERYRADLGIIPPDDRDGVLQDVHWYGGTIGGMFQGYTLGNILSAQFYQAALQAHPEIPAEMEQGRFGTLYGWLRAQIYQHGSKYTTAELVQRATGEPLRIEPYLSYLRAKYGELYELPPRNSS
jgi:carboxypeptidase Taq